MISPPADTPGTTSTTDLSDVLRIEMRPVASLTAHPANYRRHPPEQIEVLRRSIRAHGLQKPVVIMVDGTILAGHGLVEAARLEGYSQVPVHVYTGRHPDAFLIADNFSAQLALDDEPALAALLQRLAADDELAASGYTQDDLGSLITRLGIADAQSREETFEAAAAMEAEPEGPTRVQPGQVWALGRHRILCGDCTVPEHWERLMAGEIAQAVVTDPPYAVGYVGGRGAGQPADTQWDQLTAQEYRQLLVRSLRLAHAHSDERAPLYVWFASSRIRTVLAALPEAGWTERSLLIWLKHHFTGNLFSQYKFIMEPMYYCHKQGRSPRWHGPTNEVNVWQHDKPTVNDLHPTMKPVPLIERTIANATELGQLVLDPFLGSGTAIIAAERTGRRCYGLELDPHYCSVILARWEEFTRREAVRINV
jgi:DNA modification methylase